MTDTELVAAHLAGRPDAFDQLAARYHPKLNRLASDILGNAEDASDAVQEILMRLTRSLPHFRGEAQFSTWLYRLAANTCIDQLRRRSRRPETPSPLDTMLSGPAADDPDSICEETFRQQVIRQGLQQLPVSQRLILTLRDIEELSTTEVAAILEVTPGTVKSRLRRARLALRRILAAGVVVPGQEAHGRHQITSSGHLA